MTDNPMHNPSLEFAIKAIQDEARKPLEEKIKLLRKSLKYIEENLERGTGYNNCLIEARSALNSTEDTP